MAVARPPVALRAPGLVRPDPLSGGHILRRRGGYADSTPDAGPDDRVIVDNQDFHSSTACTEVLAAFCWEKHGSTAATAKPSPGWPEKLRLPPIALTRSPIPPSP